MYNIEFYEDKKGYSEFWEFLEKLRKKSLTSKDARIQYKQMILYIELLREKGANGLPVNITKHIEKDIWELRPGNNRVFYFYNDCNSYVLLHCFRKKTQKTPQKELAKAIRKREDYLRRNHNENMG